MTSKSLTPLAVLAYFTLYPTVLIVGRLPRPALKSGKTWRLDTKNNKWLIRVVLLLFPATVECVIPQTFRLTRNLNPFNSLMFGSHTALILVNFQWINLFSLGGDTCLHLSTLFQATWVDVGPSKAKAWQGYKLFAYLKV